MSKTPILVIVGPTASGKTSLSIALAKRFRGEVISADSRQVYRGLDIGSGKVTPEEMAGVPHHLLDVADPMTTYTAHDFVHDATTAIHEITDRGNLPIIAGGTFFYVDTLLGKQTIPPVQPDEHLRASLDTQSTETLIKRLQELDPKRAATVDVANRRRLVRAIEIATNLGTVPPPTPIQDTHYRALTLGIAIEKEALHHNIHIRLLERLEAGMVAEVETLLARGVTHERLEAFGLEYRYISRYLNGVLPYETMVTELETKSRQFAKRQMTWLKRDQSIIWVDKTNTQHIERVVEDFLGTTTHTL